MNMTYIMKYGFLVFSIVLTFLGFSRLMNSVEHGRDVANEYLRTAMGGSMDSDTFQSIMEGYILSNVVLGGVMFTVGLVSLLFYIYQSFKQYDKR